MPVPVIKENDPELLKYGIEDCVKCKKQTLYWWRGGVMPLCQTCATMVSETWCYKFAKKHKYGPLEG